MLPVIQIGPAVIQTSILALIAAVWIGATVAEREAKPRGVRGDEIWSIVSISIITTLVAARLIYVVQNFSAYAGDPLQVFSPAPGTLALGYGAVFGALAGYGTIQRRQVPLAPLLDAFALGGLAAIGLFALGQFLSGDAYGTPSNLPWAVTMWGEARHPVQLYDALSAFIVWGAAKKLRRNGSSALSAVIGYSAGRLMVDAFRAEAMILPNGFRMSQIIALIVLLMALWLMSQRGETYGNKSEIQMRGERPRE